MAGRLARSWAGLAALAALAALAVAVWLLQARVPVWAPDGAAALRERARSEASADPAGGSVFLVQHTFHTTVTVRLDAPGGGDWPDLRDRGRRWVDVGWGDETYFQAESGSVLMALDALLTPGPAVLHVASFDQPPAEYFAALPVIRLAVTEEGRRALLVFLRDGFQLGPDGLPVTTGPGYYGPESRFVRATGRYWAGSTCNVWTARALRAAGLPVTPGVAITAENLGFQASRLGVRVS